eukprot:6281226-Prymnesium_polylepis.1
MNRGICPPALQLHALRHASYQRQKLLHRSLDLRQEASDRGGLLGAVAVCTALQQRPARRAATAQHRHDVSPGAVNVAKGSIER